jgi:transcription antitermination protein NusB
MSLRRKSREFALQMLFQWDMSPEEPTLLEARFWRAARATKQTREFANQLFEGASAAVGAMDKLLSTHTENWRSERLSAIDRAVLRLAAYELKKGDTPPKVVLNEALELAKKYSSEDAGGFVNGVLDAVYKSLKQ